MALWLTFVLMTAAAIFAVLWPLSRRVPATSGSDVAVYRDQLDEIDRDRAIGLIGAPESEAARIEVSRRLIAAAEASGQIPPESHPAHLVRRRAAALAGLVFIPAISAGIYLTLGSPHLPGEPLAARAAAQSPQQSIQNLVSQVEAHIEKNPNDARGWDVIAPVYLRLGRFDDAVKARRNALRLGGDSALRLADLGEALAAAANGIVTTESKTAFDRALALDASDFKSRFFTGLAAQQDGQRDKAADIWRGMLENAPSGSPWVASVRQALAQLNERGPNAQDSAAANDMTPRQRAEMIGGMVSGLAAHLAQDGSDAEGWLKLVRAYMVLGERDKARAAAADARRALANDPGKLRQVESGIKELGVEG